MARLAGLKFAMVTSIFTATFIFGLFLFAMIYLLQSDWITSIAIGLSGIGLFVLFQYLMGPAVVANTTRLRYLKQGENPWLESTVKELCDKSGLPTPRLAIVPNNTPNAFTFGRTAKSAILVLHEGLLKSLNRNEVKSVIAHEIGHIKHKDYVVMTVLSTLPLIAYIIAQTTLRAGMVSSHYRGRNRKGSAALLVIGVISFIVYMITFLSVMRLSRLREHYADAYAAYVTNSPRDLESALSKITYGLSVSPKPIEGARAFYIKDPATAKMEIQQIMNKKQDYDLDRDGVLDERELELAMEKESKDTWTAMNNWFATHPPTFKRILLLREIENEMETGKFMSDRVYAHV